MFLERDAKLGEISVAYAACYIDTFYSDGEQRM